MPRRSVFLLVGAILGGAFAAAVATTPPSAHPSAGHDAWSPVRAYVEDQMDRLDVPGVAVAVVEGDRIAFAEGFGVADPSGRPVDADTPFAIASVSKWITAVAVMQLVEAGRIELGAPARRYLPGLDADVTILQLLTHASGWSTADGLQNWGALAPDADSLEANAKRLAAGPPARPAGTYRYSNANYDLLGMIVATVSGERFDAYVERHVFAPLGMDRSFTSWDAARDAGMAQGHYRFFGEVVPHDVPFVAGSLPSAFLASSAEDLARLAIAMLNGGRSGGSRLLSADSVALMERPIDVRGAPSPQALGLRVEPIAGEDGRPARNPFSGRPQTMLRRGGDLATYAADVAMLPNRAIAVVVLMNANDTTAPRPFHEVSTGIAAILEGHAPPPPSASASPSPLTVGKPILLVLLVLQLALATHPRHGHRAIARAHDALPTLIAAVVLVGAGAILLTTPSVPFPGILRVAPDVTLAIVAIVALGIPGLEPRGVRRRIGVADDHAVARPGDLSQVAPKQATSSVHVTSSG